MGDRHQLCARNFPVLKPFNEKCEYYVGKQDGEQNFCIESLKGCILV